MRTIERTAQIKRDYKRESKGRHRDELDSLLTDVLVYLVHRKRLLIKYRDQHRDAMLMFRVDRETKKNHRLL